VRADFFTEFVASLATWKLTLISTNASASAYPSKVLLMYAAVIATLPCEPFLNQALESIFTQTFAPAQVIVVVDKDAIYATSWAEDLRTRFPGVTLVRHSGRGLASALGAGIGLVQHDYVAFLDADDRWLPDKQESQITALQMDPESDVVLCYASVVCVSPDGSEKQVSLAPSATFTAATFRIGTFARFGQPDVTAHHYTWLYRWWWQARRQGIVATTITEPGLIRRIHGANSWLVENDLAHRQLRQELRNLLSTRENLSTPEVYLSTPPSPGSSGK
jgi:glycosyltransferase involved in cell wall biosynthesis